MSKKPAWTNGPWRGSDNFPMFIEDQRGVPVAVTHPHYIAGPKADLGVDCPPLEECEANGIAIAALTDLYDALGEICENPKDITQGMISRGRAALRRARGES
jgi:hypothetical protein